ncbi:VC0807 family protein [Amycolatopsis sp. NBC_00438]|uniref:VC0807 family protein n=1 Tax=Amycolatopsis sp. NBC_00438 TaxID=2903558 RepID=UPI002E23D4B0
MKERIRALAPFALDVVLPIVAYWLLHTVFGLSPFWALGIGGLATTVNAIATTVRRGKLDGFGILVVVEVALSVVLLFVSGDPRVLLLKPAFFVGVAGVYALGTLFVGHPLVLDTGRPFATGGDPRMADAYDRSWEASRPFRTAIRSVTVVWGLGFLLDAVLRVLIVYSFPPEEITDSLLLSQVPLLAVLVVIIGYTRLRMRRVRPIVLAARDGRPPGYPGAPAGHAG